MKYKTIKVKLTVRGMYEYKQSLAGAQMLTRFLKTNNQPEKIEWSKEVQEEIDKGNFEEVIE